MAGADVAGFENSSGQRVQVLTRWWNQRRERELPIIVMSSSSQEADIKRAMTLGATAYQVKPGNFDYLLAVARELGNRWLTRPDESADGVATSHGRDNR